MDIANQMILFANVVDHGSFSATARSLGQSPSAVSKQISHLEDRLGVRLLNRSTRNVSLTDEGRPFYERCARIAAGVSEAESLAVSMGSRPQGTLRIAATVAFGKTRLLPLLPIFLRDHPDLRIVLDLTDRIVDLTESDHDMAIRFTEQVDDPSVIARKLTDNDRILCASPDYIAAHGAPDLPVDLSRHNCLRISAVEEWNRWHFKEAGQTILHNAAGNFEANSADAIYHATLAGLGISRLSSYLVAADIEAGRLVHLLPDHHEDQTGVFAVYSSKRNLSPKVRVFVDYLIDHFREERAHLQTAARPAA